MKQKPLSFSLKIRRIAGFVILLIGLMRAHYFRCFLVLVAAFGYVASSRADDRTPPEYPTINYAQVKNPDLVKRGEYIAKTADCIACHTAENRGKAFAGGLGLETPFGAFFSPNITADEETGIGRWTDKQFMDAIREGNGSHGNEFPVMPFLYYSKMTDADVLALKAYLFAVPKVHNIPPENQVPWPFNVRLAQYGWKLLFFYPYRGVYQPDASQSAEWNRGRYLVEGPAHCGMCHSPLNFLGAEKRDYRYTGGFVQGYYAVDITAHGLKNYSVDDVVRVLQDGKTLNGQGSVAGPMKEAYEDSFRYLTDSDARAIAVYLKTVPNLPPPQAVEPVTPETGEKVYNKYCSSCHAVGANGAPAFGNKADWESRLQRAHGVSGLEQNAINGINSMPPMGNCVTCSKEAINATVQYMLDHSLKASGNEEKNHRNYFYDLPQLTAEQGKAVYQAHCAVCHDGGKVGAPKIGDTNTWLPLFETQNFDDILSVVIRGERFENMPRHPINGGCPKCSTAEVIAATKYLAQQGADGKYDFSLW